VAQLSTLGSITHHDIEHLYHFYRRDAYSHAHALCALMPFSEAAQTYRRRFTRVGWFGFSYVIERARHQNFSRVAFISFVHRAISGYLFSTLLFGRLD
jgi:hypothetical protein